jgi:carbamate kinase
MGPKVEAACRFVEKTGATAAIGRLEDAVAQLARPEALCLSPERT